MKKLWQKVAQLPPRFLLNHRCIHVAPSVSIYVKYQDKRSDVEIVRDALAAYFGKR